MSLTYGPKTFDIKPTSPSQVSVLSLPSREPATLSEPVVVSAFGTITFTVAESGTYQVIVREGQSSITDTAVLSDITPYDITDPRSYADYAPEVAGGSDSFTSSSDVRYTDIRGKVSNHESRVITGSHLNDISLLTGDATISGGGRKNYENVIGGQEGNINTPVSNLPRDDTVTADYSAIVGGYDNVANVVASIVGGMHTLISKDAVAGHHTIMGGSIHSIMLGGYHAIFGGTQHTILSPGTACSILGGHHNTITAAPTSGYVTIAGGKDNTASGNYASILGGSTNTASGDSSACLGGNTSTASAIGSATLGRNNEAAFDDSVAMGQGTRTTNRGGFAQAKGFFAARGDAQTEVLVVRKASTDATPVTLATDGGNQMPVISPDTTWLIRGMVAARNIAVDTESAGWTFNALVRRGASGGATIVGTPTQTLVAADTGATTWSIAFSTGTSPFNINVTGEAGKTIRWVGRLDIVQVQG